MQTASSSQPPGGTIQKDEQKSAVLADFALAMVQRRGDRYKKRSSMPRRRRFKTS